MGPLMKSQKNLLKKEFRFLDNTTTESLVIILKLQHRFRKFGMLKVFT